MREQTSGMVTYLCRIGHRYTARELLVGKELYVEQALWAALTGIDELLVIMEELRERGDEGTSARDWRARTENAAWARARLEEVIARNEPVHLDGEVPNHLDPNSRLGREG